MLEGEHLVEPTAYLLKAWARRGRPTKRTLADSIYLLGHLTVYFNKGHKSLHLHPFDCTLNGHVCFNFYPLATLYSLGSLCSDVFVFIGPPAANSCSIISMRHCCRWVSQHRSICEEGAPQYSLMSHSATGAKTNQTGAKCKKSPEDSRQFTVFL